MRFIKNNFFEQSHDFFDFSDTEVLDTILTDSESDVGIVILSSIEIIDLIVESSISRTSSFTVAFRMTVELDKALTENLIDSIFFTIVSSIFSNESDIKFLLNETLNEIIISFFF